jgi:hypothetical protein
MSRCGDTNIKHYLPLSTGSNIRLGKLPTSPEQGFYLDHADRIRWSFGGNRLQLKAEDKIISDVLTALTKVSDVGCNTRWPYTSLQAKQDLLQVLLENERTRLRVWLYPLEPDRKHNPPQFSKHLTEVCFFPSPFLATF